MSKKKDLTIEEYKETPLDDIDDIDKDDDNYNYNEKFTFEDDGLDLEKKAKPKKTGRKKQQKVESEEKHSYTKTNKIINIVFGVIIVILTAISIDVICVGRYNKGPFFAIKTTTEKDGGTKIYYGLGYKVIKYHQLEGRRGMEIGTWKLEYNTDPLELSALDLAIEFTRDSKSAYNNIYNKYVKVTGTLISKDVKNNKLALAYQDEDHKYTLNIICSMDKDAKINSDLEEEKNETIVGTIAKYEIKDGKKTLYINNCFSK